MSDSVNWTITWLNENDEPIDNMTIRSEFDEMLRKLASEWSGNKAVGFEVRTDDEGVALIHKNMGDVFIRCDCDNEPYHLPTCALIRAIEHPNNQIGLP